MRTELTFLFTDVVGSTALWERDPGVMAAAMALHDQLAADVVSEHGGRLVKPRGEGDSLFVVFESPAAALVCGAALQRGVAATVWPTRTPITVRAAVHTGMIEARDDDFYGPTVNRAARLRGAAHPGQVVVSAATAEHAGTLGDGLSLRPLGPHRLRGIGDPEEVFQLCGEGLRDRFPALPGALDLAAEALERDRELEVLSGLIKALQSGGTGGAALIEGPPGIGKSTLLSAALDGAATDLTVLRARGSELEAGLAFGAVRQLLGPAVVRLDAAEQEALFAGPAALARAVLGLGAAPDALADPLYGLYWLLADFAERSPVILALDDLHWFDEESGRFVAYLARRLEGIAVLVLATARPDEPGATDAPAAALRACARVVRPQPLSPDAVAVLMPGHPVADVHRATGGNPLLVAELKRALDQSPGASIEEVGSASVGRSVLQRVERVSPEAGTLARALALFPAGALLDDVAAVAGLGPDAAAEAADALVAAQLLADDEPLAFLHPVMRTAIYHELGSFARRRGHARAAALLKERGAPPEAIAAHLLAGRPEGDAANVEILRAAARVALAGAAPRAAVRYLERALEEPPPPGPERAALRHELGRLQFALGRPEAAATLAAALEETTGSGARAQVGLDLGRCLTIAGRPDEAETVLLAAGREPDLDPQQRLAIDGMLVQAAWDGGSPEVYAEVLRRLPADVGGATAAERMALASVAYDRLCRLEPVHTVAALLMRAAESLTDFTEAPETVRLIVVQLQLCGEFETVAALADEWRAQAREIGAEAEYAAARSVSGDLAWLRGDLRAAEEIFRLGIDSPPVQDYDRNHQRLVLVEVLLMQGRVDDAGEVAGELPRRARSGALNAHYERARALVTFARGDPAAALSAFERLEEELRARNSVNPAELIWRFDHARALQGCGRGDDAVAIMTPYLADAQRFGEPLPIGIGHVSLGLLTGDRGHLEAAHEVLRDSYYRWWAARAALELGAALRREHRTEAARGHLRAALDYAEREGATPIAQRAREELVLAGERPGRGVHTLREALTPLETRIAQLAAEGMTSTGIAQHLFLTVKTVESHLASVSRKRAA